MGVSAQQPGVRALVAADPQRYSTLDHPGAPFSLDIFTKAGRALTRHSGADPLAGLEPEHLIAIGQSQSASYLISYVNGVQPLVEVFDGFLLQTPAQAGRIRTDLDQPTLVFVTESELAGFGYVSVRQPDSASVRIWEVAGAAHADGVILQQSGYASVCRGRVNEGPHRQVLRAALHQLVAWAASGAAPPKAPRVELVTETGKRRRVVIERDEHGNAVGGIRTPLVDVPVSTLSGEPALSGAAFCTLFGSTTPFDAATLARLYPTHDAYVSAFTASTEAAVRAGFILRPEADEMIAEAEQSAIGTSGL